MSRLSRGIAIRTFLAFALAACAFAAVPALAGALSYERAYAFKTQAGGVAIAVDRGSGVVYVAEALDFSTFGGRLQRFDAAGDPLTPGSFGSGTYGGVAVDQASQHVQAFDADLDSFLFGLPVNPVIETFDSSGAAVGTPFPVTANSGFDLNQIAVDSAGTIYYPSAASDSVEKFSPTGTPLGSIGAGGALVDPSSVAVDSEGNVYVVDGTLNGAGSCGPNTCDDVTNGRVQKFAAAGGAPLATVDPANASSVAVDPATDNVLVGNGIGASFEVVVYDESGVQLTSFGAGHFGDAQLLLGGFNSEIAVAAGGRVYVTDPGGTPESSEVEAFDVLPEAATGEALAVGHGGATLAGTVDPNGSAIFHCRFEYGPTSAYGSSVPCAEDAGSGTEPVDVSAQLSGLSPGATYHFRLVATNLGGSTGGGDRMLQTVPVAPTPPAPPAAGGAPVSAAPGTCASDAALCPPQAKPPLRCRKGFHKKTVKRAVRCVKVKRHKAKKRKGAARLRREER